MKTKINNFIKIMSQKAFAISLICFFIYMSSNMGANIYVNAQVEDKPKTTIIPPKVKIEGAENGIVICGNGNNVKGSDTGKPCTVSDIFKQANQFAGFILKVIFPAVFFFGLFMVAWPLVNQLQGEASANDMALVKKRAKYLVIGTIFTVGAFLIIKTVLSNLGYTEVDTIANPVSTPDKQSINIPSIFIEKAYAIDYPPDSPLPSATASPATNTDKKVDPDSFLPNPLADLTVQSITLGIVNVLAYIIIVCCILGIIRGVMYLLLTQENPENLQKGKKWILRSLGAAALVFGAQMIYGIIIDTVTSVTK